LWCCATGEKIRHKNREKKKKKKKKKHTQVKIYAGVVLEMLTLAKKLHEKK